MANRLLILGGGESGVGCAKLAQQRGWQVFLSDKSPIKPKYKSVLLQVGIEFEEGNHSEKAFEQYDVLVKSPGIPPTVPIIKHHAKAKTRIESEIEFAYRYTDAFIIGITGTNGKTTTASLTYHLLHKAGLNVALCGNVGMSMAGVLAEKEYDYLVVEISSFQLDDIHDFKPNISMILNITPDHLERYGTMEKYVDSKFKIIQNQTEENQLIYEAESEEVTKRLKQIETTVQQFPLSIKIPQVQGAQYDENNKTINITVNQKQVFMSIHELALQGKHNMYNSMAASVAGRILELRKDVIRESLSDFQNVEHRLEFVSSVCGVKYINDSKATNVNSAWYALESVDAPVVWIAGGVDKGNDYTALLPLVKKKVKAIVCCGTDNTKIKEFFGEHIEFIFEATNMSEAVGIAYRMSEKKDTVLLSPACASFDLFENFEDRGRQFKEAVRAL